MASTKSKGQLAPLPWAEMLAYWVLSFGAHLYSFYQLHIFSKAHEAGLEREFQLEKGLVKGFKRDPSDFEWTFWTEWAKKSLLWTLAGHGVISRLTSIFYPKLRVPALTIYGFLAASSVLGIRGVSVLLVHLGLSFSVALLQKSALSWATNLLLLSTLHIRPLQEIQRGWYKTEEEYYLLLFSVAVCGLRFISFSLERCWSPGERRGALELCWLLSYTFYHPFFFNGPVVTYPDYIEQMQRSSEECDGDQSLFTYLVLRLGRIILWWCTAEYLIHVMYMHCIQSNETYLEILPPWALGGLALALVQFFFLKYLVLFGLPSTLATLDKLVPPKLPRCVSIMYSFTGMWRHFDEGLYRWLIRYIYVPLGGSRHGHLYKMLSTGLAFGFVCLWHGGHDYLQYWALMNWAGVLVENGLKSLFASSVIRSVVEQNVSAAMERRCVGLLCAVSTAMLILSNLVFLGGTHVGRVFWKRVFIQGWSTVAPPMLAFLYCFAQIGLQWTSHPP
uniref:Hedgehog acyltransferase n=1 Tax=Gasterosteus aculeatus aculeatus TaxID=481459 RepID=G3PA28_GASAC|nr:protein-cysteine N-palmitoyltransferase HHAT [Gasterosteus aculeatus aculeatus]XP_040033855.1 protein-cysteine N-palmitoyltransferase HHAT [Gasterosteus aculeatus aculeatus]XP_040033856.1 protein-cysteine N-palmitoyltransferase HHAT [Gasterosteus aculeatus aculeatus]